VITLDGLGSRFSGDYYVTQSTHELDERGYGTRFEVRRGVAG
jgi:phage protein D